MRSFSERSDGQTERFVWTVLKKNLGGARCFQYSTFLKKRNRILAVVRRFASLHQKHTRAQLVIMQKHY